MSAELPDSLYVSIPVASRILGIHRQTLDKAIARGEFVTKRIAGREMVLTSSLLPDPEPMTLWWRHYVELSGIRMWIAIEHNSTAAVVQVIADAGFGAPTVEVEDSKRMIPVDLEDGRIAAETTKEIATEALLQLDPAPAASQIKKVLADIAKNFPENRPARSTSRV